MKYLLVSFLLISKIGISQINCSNGIMKVKDSLYVVDGRPWVGKCSPLQCIKREDISYISTMDKADATAIYGSRGAVGAILITTKRKK